MKLVFGVENVGEMINPTPSRDYLWVVIGILLLALLGVGWFIE